MTKFKSKKKVKPKGGKEFTVYEYSERQVADRNKAKAERVEKLRNSLGKLRSQIKKDLKSGDIKKKMTALAVGLINDTYERVGNSSSAAEGHFGVTGWQAKHVHFGNGGATIKYVGKSGVDQEKKVKDSGLVGALKEAMKGKKGTDPIFQTESGKITPSSVNAYLKPFAITAKDIRGMHANRVMQEKLKAQRSKGSKLPSDPKEKEKILKTEFKQALEETSKAVGHEPSTLKNQYLVPGMEDDFMRDGKVQESMRKKKAALEEELHRKMETLISDYQKAQDEGHFGYELSKTIGATFAKWFTDNFRVDTRTTPRGGKKLKEEAQRLLYWCKTGGDFPGGPDNLRTEWERFQPLLPQFMEMFSLEGGGANVPKEMKGTYATYLNDRGISKKRFEEYVKVLEQVFGALRGWRQKALVGDFRVGLAGPDKFRGTSAGRYGSEEDILWIRATPKVMRRSGGTYASPEYIMIHELGHRYERKNYVKDFDSSQWWTTNYSRVDGMAGSEAFAELFALGHFGITSERGRDFSSVLDKFERVMTTGKTAAVMPKTQYHATSWDRVPEILSSGLQLPNSGSMSTHMYRIPSISTASKPQDASVYHPHGALLEVKVRPGAKYLKRSIRGMQKGENLEQSVNRWLEEVREAKADGFHVVDMQSTVGNQTINPRVLEVVQVVNIQDAPLNARTSKMATARLKTGERLTKEWLMGVRRAWLQIEKRPVQTFEDAFNKLKELQVIAKNLKSEALYTRRAPSIEANPDPKHGGPEHKRFHLYWTELMDAILGAKSVVKHWAEVYNQSNPMNTGQYQKEQGETMLRLYQTDWEEATGYSVQRTRSTPKNPWGNSRVEPLTFFFDRVMKVLREDAAYIKRHTQDGSSSPYDHPVFLDYTIGKMRVILQIKDVSAMLVKQYQKRIEEVYYKIKRAGFEKLWFGTLLIFSSEPRKVNEREKEQYRLLGYNIDAFSGQYLHYENEIWVWNHPTSYLVQIIAHELGHRFYFKYMPKKDRDRFRAWIEEGLLPVTGYGGTKPSEAFAEVFGYYVQGEDLTRDQLETFKEVIHKQATKTHGEKEDEEVERLNRPEPKQKPPRKDLRRERIDVDEDEDTKTEGADKDPDMSLNYKRVATRVAAAWVGRLAGLVDKNKSPKSEGDYWKTPKGWGVWPPGTKQPTSAPDEPTAKARAQGSGEGEEQAPTEEQGAPEEEQEQGKRQQDLLEDEELFERDAEKRKKRYQKELKKFDGALKEMGSSNFKTLIEGLSGNGKKAVVREYNQQIKALQAGMFSVPGQISEEVIADATKALKDDKDSDDWGGGGGSGGSWGGWFGDDDDDDEDSEWPPKERPPKGKRPKGPPRKKKKSPGTGGKSPEEMGRELAIKFFAKKVLANPTIIGGVKVSPHWQEASYLENRTKESFEHFTQLTKELRKEASKQMSKALDGLSEKSPKREELLRLKDGLKMAAIVNGETLDGTAEDTVAPAFQLFAKTLHERGEDDKLLKLSKESFYSPEGRDIIKTVMEDLSDEDLFAFAGGEEGSKAPLIEVLKKGKMTEPQEAFYKGVLRDLTLNTMSTGHEVFVRSAMDTKSKDSVHPKSTKKLQKKMEAAHQEADQDKDVSSFLSEILRRTKKAESWEDVQGLEEMTGQLQAKQMKAVLKAARKHFGELPEGDEIIAQAKRLIETGDGKELNYRYVKKEDGKNNTKSARKFQSSAYNSDGMNGGLFLRPFFLMENETHIPQEDSKMTLNKKAAVQITAKLDTMANLIQKHGAQMGIPKKIAQDFAHRCDLLSDHVEKEAGMKVSDFNPSDIGREVAGPLEGAGEEYMRGEFTQQENRELRDRQESGALGINPILEPEAPRPGRQASFDEMGRQEVMRRLATAKAKIERAGFKVASSQFSRLTPMLTKLASTLTEVQTGVVTGEVDAPRVAQVLDAVNEILPYIENVDTSSFKSASKMVRLATVVAAKAAEDDKEEDSDEDEEDE